MAFFVKVRNTNPIGPVTLTDPDIGQRYHADAGEVIEVPPELAGQPARWRRVEVDKDGHPTERHDLHETREHAGHLELRDLGTGLLSQVGNWEAVTDDEQGDDEQTDDNQEGGAA